MAKRITDTTPKQDGFRMPGEFEKHKKTWIIWPERPDNWRLGGKPAQAAFVEVAKAISRFEPVTMVVSRSQYDNARAMLPEYVRVVEMSNDDAWMRDVGPTFLVNDKGDVRGVDWAFNAWGGLYDGLYFPWDRDDKIAQKICEIEEVDTYRTPEFIMEGGAIHVDGDGTLVVVEECLLSGGRNVHMSKEEMTEFLKEYLNVDKVIWLPRGIYNDETNGHVDNIFCFVKPGEVIIAWSDNEDDPQYEISKEVYEHLCNETDAKGRKFKIHKLPVPNPPVTITAEESGGIDVIEGTLPREEGDRQAASYVNFYIVNGGIVFPYFGNEKYDKIAEDMLKEIFPDREVVGVSAAREIILGGGNIHCITQQQPLG